ncbi:Psi-producing oxygenase A, partial [Bienertia sinuspersici]
MTERCWACKACGKLGHSTERCWTVIGYPNKGSRNFKDGKNGKGKEVIKPTQKSVKGKFRMAVHAYNTSSSNQSVGITTEQSEQLLKLLPAPSKSGEEDCETKQVRAVGKESYKYVAFGELDVPTVVSKSTKVNMITLWHLRLGHAPLQRLRTIQGLKYFGRSQPEDCLTCP